MGPSRRHFLRGAAGVTLAIPFLGSIEPKQARAGGSVRRRFVAMGTEHGGIWGANMHPSAPLSQSQSYAGHTIRRGALSLEVDGGMARLSPVLSASSGVFTSALASKMNVLRGLDISWYIAHHQGGHLGNFGINCQHDAVLGAQAAANQVPTIDQVLAYSPKFYSDLSTNLKRSIICGDGGMSHNYANPSAQSGGIQPSPAVQDSKTLFSEIFVPPDDGTEKRAPVVDHVLEDYKRLRNGNRRLSAADRERLDAHIERVDELDRKLNVAVTCGEIEPPATSSTDLWGGDYGHNFDKMRQFWELFNDVVVAAFACDTSRIVVYRITDTFSDYLGADWHQDVAHRAHQVTPQAPLPDVAGQEIMAASYQRVFEGIYLDLVAKLDAVDDGEGTVLDSSAVVWTHESGPYTHDSVDMPVIMAGSAAGSFTTGSHIDYRNMEKTFNAGGYEGSVEVTRPGLLWNQYLGTLLQGMGLDPEDYEHTPEGGYGLLLQGYDNDVNGHWPSSVISAAPEFLPYLKA